MQFAENRLLLLVEEAHRPEELDVAQLRDRLQEAERRLSEAEEDTEKRRAAERDKRRWERFLRDRRELVALREFSPDSRR